MAEPGPLELEERVVEPRKDCEEHPANWGRPSSAYHYIWKGNKDQSKYPPEACLPWYHKTAQIDSLKVNSDIFGTATAINVPAATITCNMIYYKWHCYCINFFVGPTIF